MKIITLFLLTCFICNSVHAGCKFRVRTAKVTPEQHSLRYILAENGSWSGFTIDITAALLQEAGCEYSFHPLTWKRALVDLEDGHIDIMMNVSLTERREKFAYFVGPMDEEKMVLIVRKDANYQIDTLDDFKRIPGKFSFERGAYLGEAFAAKQRSDPAFAKKFENFAGGDITNYERLSLGRLSGFIADDFEVATQLGGHPDLTRHPFTINHNWVYWAVSKKSVSPELALSLYQAYARLKNRKVFETIAQRYINHETP